MYNMTPCRNMGVHLWHGNVSRHTAAASAIGFGADSVAAGAVAAAAAVVAAAAAATEGRGAVAAETSGLTQVEEMVDFGGGLESAGAVVVSAPNRPLSYTEISKGSPHAHSLTIYHSSSAYSIPIWLFYRAWK